MFGQMGMTTKMTARNQKTIPKVIKSLVRDCFLDIEISI